MTDRDWPVATLPPQLIPRQRAISYTRTDSLGRNVIRRYDLTTNTATTIAPALRGRTVHAWTPRGVLLMGKGNKVFALDPAVDSSWREAASFSSPELRSINTYVVSPQGDKVILISPVRPPLATLLLDSLQAGSSAASVLSAFRGQTLPSLTREWDVSEGALMSLARDQQSRSAANAVALAEFTAGLYPLSYGAHLQLGTAQRAAGNETAAIAAFRRSLELNPKVTEGERRDATRAEEALAAATRI
jgi:hypothetical protein